MIRIRPSSQTLLIPYLLEERMKDFCQAQTFVPHEAQAHIFADVHKLRMLMPFSPYKKAFEHAFGHA